MAAPRGMQSARRSAPAVRAVPWAPAIAEAYAKKGIVVLPWPAARVLPMGIR
jgi:hypothetical protein